MYCSFLSFMSCEQAILRWQENQNYSWSLIAIDHMIKHYDSRLVTGWLDQQRVNMRVSCIHKFARVAYYK